MLCESFAGSNPAPAIDLAKVVKYIAITTSLAQSVERWPFKPVVVGSSPTGGANKLVKQQITTNENQWQVKQPSYPSGQRGST